MKKTALLTLSGIVVTAFVTVSSAGVFDQNCQMCHRIDGQKGAAKASKDVLLKKFKTRDEFLAGAKAATDSDMESIKNDIKLLTDAATDIGLE